MRFPNLSLFPKKSNDDSDIEYASFSGRTFAMTLDLLVLFLLLSPVFSFISRLMFPEFYELGGEQRVREIFTNVGLQRLSSEQAFQQLLQLGVFGKMLTDYTLQFVVSGALIVFSWVKYDTTPGLFIFRMYVADASTGGSPTLTQYIIRYVMGVVAIVPLMLGMFWMFFNRRNMALHDVIARTVVLRRKFRFKRKEESDEETLGE